MNSDEGAGNLIPGTTGRNKKEKGRQGKKGGQLVTTERESSSENDSHNDDDLDIEDEDDDDDDDEDSDASEDGIEDSSYMNRSGTDKLSKTTSEQNVVRAAMA